MEREKLSEPWTNEKHSHYLDAIEASFVRTMLEDRHNARRTPRLDRYMPDSSDSTQDSPSHARNKHQISSSSGKSKMEAKDDKRWRRRATNSSGDSSSSTLDQVVPQLSYKSDKGGKD